MKQEARMKSQYPNSCIDYEDNLLKRWTMAIGPGYCTLIVQDFSAFAPMADRPAGGALVAKPEVTQRGPRTSVARPTRAPHAQRAAM
jgi:hypothetical protein